MNYKITIVGAGLAGSEAALVLSSYSDINIKLIEMRPKLQTDVHKTSSCAELVCSNSFKSLKYNSAAGMLKYELAALGSPILECAINSKVEAGNALAVDRILFANDVTEKIHESKNIEYVNQEFVDISDEIKNCDVLILCSGPLTSNALAKSIQNLTGEDELSFYDAAAPIVMADSLNMDKLFVKDRYNENAEGSYINAPFTKEEYGIFINALLDAECVIKKSFESKDLFQACQPIEEIARTGFDAPRYGTMKPIGLDDPKTGKRPYAVVQLRSENSENTSYNIVGFQTNLTFAEQKRVFQLIPGLENAEFARFGVMHKNTFINAPKLLDTNLHFENNIYFAGQLSGTEGYFEAVRSGHHVALSVLANIKNIDIPNLSRNCAFGSLIDYATNPDTKNYQPMHVNFGILPPLDKKIRNKQERYTEFANRGKISFDEYIENLNEIGLINNEAIDRSSNLKDRLENLWVKK